MFTADSNITDLNIKERSIHKMLFSMNIHEIATPELTVEDARCYILFFKEMNALAAYIALYFPRSDRRFYYSHDANPFREETLAEVEDEARGFAESMGFVLDEVNIAVMSSEEKNRWIDEQDIWGPKKPTETKEEVSPAPAQPSTPAEPSPNAQQTEQPAGSATVESAAPAAEQPQARQQTSPQPRKRPAETPRPSPSQSKAAAVEPVSPPPVKKREDVVREAVKAGIVKPPKQELKKAIQGSTGVVSRDKEALARLFASF